MNVMNKKYVAASAVALGAVGVLGVTGAFASEELKTFTGLKGIEHALVSMTAEILEIESPEVILKDTETGDEYTSRISRKAEVELEEGSIAEIEGFVADPENAPFNTDVTFKVTSVDGEELQHGGRMMKERFENMTEEEKMEFRARVEEKGGRMGIHRFADGDGQCNRAK